MTKNLLKSIVGIFLILGMISTISCFGSKDKSPWIWEAGGKKYTVNDLEAAYKIQFDQIADQLKMLGISEETLKNDIKNPKAIPASRQSRQYMMAIEGLQKDKFIKQYKQLILVYLEAKDSKYIQSEEFKKQLEFNKLNFISTMYIKHITQVKEPTRQECVAYFELMRKKDKRFLTVPIDPDGILYAKRSLMMEKLKQANANEMERIALEQKIVSNKDFNLNEYLAKEKKETVKEEDKKKENLEKKDKKK